MFEILFMCNDHPHNFGHIKSIFIIEKMLATNCLFDSEELAWIRILFWYFFRNILLGIVDAMLSHSENTFAQALAKERRRRKRERERVGLKDSNKDERSHSIIKKKKHFWSRNDEIHGWTFGSTCKCCTMKTVWVAITKWWSRKKKSWSNSRNKFSWTIKSAVNRLTGSSLWLRKYVNIQIVNEYA